MASIRAFPTFVRSSRTLFPARTVNPRRRFMASQGYGDGAGDPKGEKPQDQGKSSTASGDVEHPGPTSPSAEQGKGSASKGQGDGKDAASGKRQFSTSAAHRGEDSKAKDGARPKIHEALNDGKEKQSAEKQADVEQHNKEFDQKHDKAAGHGTKVDQQ